MPSSHQEVRSFPAPGPDAADPATHRRDRIRDALAVRLQRLELLCPEALDLEAEVLAELGDQLRGQATALSGEHAPQNFRASLLGGKCFRLSDLCRLAIQAPDRVVASLALIAEAAGHTVVKEQGTPTRSISVEAAELVEATSALSREAAAADEDGYHDEAEILRMERKLARVKSEVADVEEKLRQSKRGRRARS